MFRYDTQNQKIGNPDNLKVWKHPLELIIERFEHCIWKPMNTDQLWNKPETTVFIWIDPQMMNAEHISA